VPRTTCPRHRAPRHRYLDRRSRLDDLEVPVAKLSFLAGFGAGYVLGARAGRGRYEQIRRAWEHAKDDPRMQSLAGVAQAKADDALASLRTRMGSEPPR
jgi:hypothetical protein